MDVRRTLGIRLLTVGTCVAICGGASRAEGPDALERLQALSTAVRSQVAWRGRYVQHYVEQGMQQGDTIAGRIWMGWPDRVLFEPDDASAVEMGYDGRLFRLVSRADASCNEHEPDPSEVDAFPLAVLLDPHRAVDRFTVLAAGDDGLTLSPRDTGDIERVEITTGADGLPASVRIEYTNGAVNRFEFSSWASRRRPPAGGWLPAAPADVKCAGDDE